VAKLDKRKEEIGWLKVIFGISLVTGISLVAWIAQNYDHIPTGLLLVCLTVLFLVATGIGWINRTAYRKIDQLEDL